MCVLVVTISVCITLVIVSVPARSRVMRAFAPSRLCDAHGSDGCPGALRSQTEPVAQGLPVGDHRSSGVHTSAVRSPRVPE
jgi:hypothetical protein